MRTLLVLAILGTAGIASADLQRVTVTADQAIDVGGTTAKSDVEAALVGAPVLKAMDRCKNGGDLLAFVVFQNGRVAQAEVGGATDRTFEKCVATGLRAATLAAKTRVIVTATVHVPMPAINVGNVPTADVVEKADPVGESLDRDEIRRVVARNKGSIRACFEAERRQNPDAMGKVVVKIEVAPSGSVESATVASSTFKTDAVASCTVAAIKRFKFPPKSSKTMLSYPFAFSSVE